MVLKSLGVQSYPIQEVGSCLHQVDQVPQKGRISLTQRIPFKGREQPGCSQLLLTYRDRDGFILNCLLPWEWETLALQPPPPPRLSALLISSLSQSYPPSSLSTACICDHADRSVRGLLCGAGGPGDPFPSAAERPGSF